MKRCVRCGQSKPLSEFHKNRSKPGGYQKECKLCHASDSRRWRARPKSTKATHKTCRDCGQTKPISDFYRSKKHADGYNSLCRQCYRKIDSRWYRVPWSHTRHSVPLRLAELLQHAKRRAKSRGLAYNLSLPYLLELWRIASGCCQLTGLPFVFATARQGIAHPYGPSLHRVIPARGYIEGNVQIVLYKANTMLGRKNIEEFRAIARAFANGPHI